MRRTSKRFVPIALAALLGGAGRDGGAGRGARVRLWGGGLSARTKTTGPAGKATFYVRPTRRSSIALRTTKAGFLPASLLIRVR